MARGVRLLALALALSGAAAVIGKRDWRKMDWDKWEKDLEEGDEPDLLEPEDKAQIKEYERRRGMGMQMPDDDVQLKCVQQEDGGVALCSAIHRSLGVAS